MSHWESCHRTFCHPFVGSTMLKKLMMKRKLKMDLRNVPANVRWATPNAVQLWKVACFSAQFFPVFGLWLLALPWQIVVCIFVVARWSYRSRVGPSCLFGSPHFMWNVLSYLCFWFRSFMRDVYRDDVIQITAEIASVHPSFAIWVFLYPSSVENLESVEGFPVFFLASRLASLVLWWSICHCFSPCFLLLGLFVLAV